jgi:tetratricopeptide (TPR) repeat protein
VREDIVRSSVQAETPDQAQAVIATFTDTGEHAVAQAVIATALANAGRPAEAVQMAAGMDGKPGALAWLAIAEAQAKAGLTAQSITSFDRAFHAALAFNPHDRLLSKIAVSLADAGQIDEALHVASLIGGDRRDAMRAIAKAQARAGIPPGPGVDAEALADAGRVDEAIKAAAKEDRFQRPDLLAQIAKARAVMGRIGEAKQLTQHVTDPRYRAGALASIAAAQVKAGLKADAMVTFTEALQVTQSISFKKVAAEELIGIAAKLPD